MEKEIHNLAHVAVLLDLARYHKISSLSIFLPSLRSAISSPVTKDSLRLKPSFAITFSLAIFPGSISARSMSREFFPI